MIRATRFRNLGRVAVLSLMMLALHLASVSAQVRLSSDESSKLIIEQQPPRYPPLARAAKIEGTVKIDLTVSEAGVPVSAKVIEGHPLLRNAASGAALSRKYKPYVIDGKPVPFVTTVEFVFSVTASGPASNIASPKPDPENEVARKLFAEEDKCRALFRSDKLAEAEAACRSGVKLADQLANDRSLEKMTIHQLLGNVLTRQKRYQESLESYSRALTFARMTLEDKNAELGLLYGHIGMSHHALNDLDRAREFYSKAEKSLQLAYDGMSCDDCAEEVNQIRHDYMRSLKNFIRYHVLAAEQAGQTQEAEELKRLAQKLPD